MLFAERLPQLFRCCCRLLGIALLASMVAGAHAQADARQNTIKAGLLYNFFSFVQWPQKTDSTDAPFVVGVVGDGSFDGVLAELNGKSVKGRRIETRKLSDLSNVQGIHMVVITPSEEKRFREILDQTKNHSVLTIGEFSTFTREGGMINLVPASNRYQLEINPDAAEKAGLTISSQLLKLARIYKS